MRYLYVILLTFILQTGFASSDKDLSIYFVRETNLMVLTQIVQLSVDGEKIEKLGQGERKKIVLKPGKYKFETKVGLSLGFPNVTGFNGAKKFKGTFNLKKPEHYFKVFFKPALLGGKHHIIEIDKKEFLNMSEENEDSEGHSEN